MRFRRRAAARGFGLEEGARSSRFEDAAYGEALATELRSLVCESNDDAIYFYVE